MIVVADLQLHSRFSRAVSHQMTIPFIAQWARKKGIGLIATGDWTHPLWIREIQANLEELGNGLLRLKTDHGLRVTNNDSPSFLLATEISSIYSQAGKLRRVHTLVWVPTIASALKIIEAMRRRGCNLGSDGRPIVGLSCINLAELVLSIEPTALIIPAHAWTPWFSVYGSLGGFDSLDEAFGPFAKNIYAVETGLSSNPSMNWRITELDNRSIVSFSDAHSGPKLGREATVFNLSELSYSAIRNAIIQRFTNNDSRITNNHISYTIEFYPEEGKYHYTGHRTCGISWGPEETKTKGTTCPVCHKPLTQGVMQRVEELAGRSEESLQLSVISYPLSDARPSGSQSTGQLKTDKPKSENRQQKTDNRIQVRFIKSSAFPHRPPFAMLVPLQEIIAEAVESTPTSQKVQSLYDTLTTDLSGEFSVLLQQPISAISHLAGEKVADGIDRVRRGDITIDPGYDGVFGKVKIWGEEKEGKEEEKKEQLSLF